MQTRLSQPKLRVAAERMRRLCEEWASANNVDITKPKGQKKAIAAVLDSLDVNHRRKTFRAKLGLQHLSENVPRERQYRKSAARRARLAGAVTSPVDREAIVVRDGLRCYICGSEVTPEQVHLDHVTPLSRGGAHTPENIRVSCARCNLRKGAQTPSEYAASLLDVRRGEVV